MRIVVCALLARVLVGCASEHDETYHADASFTAEERVEILRNTALLASLTGHPLEVVFDGAAAERTIVRSADGSAGSIDQPTGHVKIIHVGIVNTGFRPDLSSSAQDVAEIVAHEMMHGLGMTHVSDPSSLMWVDWQPGGFRWSAADQADCDRARARGWRTADPNAVDADE